MKKIKLLILFVMTFFIYGNVSASDTLRAVIFSSDGKAANVRTGPGTQNTRVAYAQMGAVYNLVSETVYPDTNNHKNCSKDWYQIYYNGVATGYVCGEHVELVRSYSTDNVAPQTACEQEMANLGFPSSYWGGLCNLRSKHANWSFVALYPKISWPEVINRESECGINLISNTTANAGFIDNSCTKYTGSFVPILPKGVAYYMDPRNFLSERYIFQFMHLAYDPNFVNIYSTGTTSILQGTAVYNYHLERGYNIADAINRVGASMNVSPIFTAARIRQELGSGNSEENLYSGVYTGFNKEYYGYYNFYNISVSDSCVKQYGKEGREYCGLSYAKKNGWNSVEKGISGGVSFLANSYINNTQFTSYLQKFDVNRDNPDKIGGHQYMASIEGAKSESETTYTTYKDMNILNSAFVFYIPVYSNMDATISNVGSGATGEAGVANPSSSAIATIVTSSGYRYEGGYISNIAVGTDAATLIGTIESIGGYGSVSLKDSKGNVKTSGVVATGDTVTITNQSGTETLTIVVKGDTSGDGKINALDLLQVQKNILKIYNLSGAYGKAGDTSGDGKINALDLLQVQKNILGLYNIVQ